MMRPNPKVAAERLAMLRDYSASQARSQQERVGMSEVGGCSRHLALRLLNNRTINHDTQVLASLRGTAVHRTLEEALPPRLNGALMETPVEYAGLLGHLDLYVDGVVEDAKSKDKDGMSAVKSYGADRGHLWQIHLYGAGLIKLGYKVHTVRLTYYSVSSPDDVYVLEQPYDPDVTDEAIRHYNSVSLAVSDFRLTGDVGMLPPPEKDAVTWCSRFCRFYSPDAGTGCPGRSDKPATYDDVSLGEMWGDGGAPDEQALADYARGKALSKEGDTLKRAAREQLYGMRGVAGGLSLSWTDPEPREVPDGDAALDKLAELGLPLPVKVVKASSNIVVKEVKP